MDFREIMRGKEAGLEMAIRLQAQEGLQLDFKRPASDKDGAMFAVDGRLSKDGRRAIAKALSAFSNSAGGVIVVGVECRKNPEGVDSAQSLDPVPNWRTALSSVSSSVSDLLQPKNDGIRVEGFASKGNAAAGYLVIDVPRSERRPHMCQMTRQYFRRSGSNSFSMEHFDIEDAFRRASVPDLTLRTMFRRISSSGPQAQFHLEFWLENEGEATAFFPSIHLYRAGTFDAGWPNNVLGVHREGMPDGQMSYGNSEFVIHPGQTRQIEKLEMHFVFDSSKRVVEFVGGVPVSRAALRLRYSVFAKDMRRKAGELVLGAPQFMLVEWENS